MYEFPTADFSVICTDFSDRVQRVIASLGPSWYQCALAHVTARDLEVALPRLTRTRRNRLLKLIRLPDTDEEGSLAEPAVTRITALPESLSRRAYTLLTAEVRDTLSRWAGDPDNWPAAETPEGLLHRDVGEALDHELDSLLAVWPAALLTAGLVGGTRPSPIVPAIVVRLFGRVHLLPPEWRAHVKPLRALLGEAFANFPWHDYLDRLARSARREIEASRTPARALPQTTALLGAVRTGPDATVSDATVLTRLSMLRVPHRHAPLAWRFRREVEKALDRPAAQRGGILEATRALVQLADAVADPDTDADVGELFVTARERLPESLRPLALTVLRGETTIPRSVPLSLPPSISPATAPSPRSIGRHGSGRAEVIAIEPPTAPKAEVVRADPVG